MIVQNLKLIYTCIIAVAYHKTQKIDFQTIKGLFYSIKIKSCCSQLGNFMKVKAKKENVKILQI